MTIDIKERESTAGQSRIGTVVIGVIALLLLFPSVRSAIGFGGSDTKCAPWPDKQGEWYSAPPELLTMTSDYPRMVDKTGVWAKGGFGLTIGWIYAAKTPQGPLAYWAVAKDVKPHRGAIYDSDGQIIETKFISWMGLNREAVALSISATNSALGVDSESAHRMLTDRIKDSIAHCLGY